MSMCVCLCVCVCVCVWCVCETIAFSKKTCFSRRLLWFHVFTFLSNMKKQSLHDK